VPSRIKYWLSVGAQPSDHVAVFLKKYMEKWEKIETEGPPAAQQQPEGQQPAAPAEAPAAPPG
jgi:small subunit ribosomal protein S16